MAIASGRSDGRGAALFWARRAAHAHWDFRILLCGAHSIGGGMQ